MTSDQDANDPTPPESATGPVLLVIEDVPVIHDVIELSLRRLKASYVSAVTGAEALEHLKTLTPELIILDLALPGIDGWEVLKSVRSTPRLDAVPVIVITAHGPGVEHQVMELGANAYLDKPFLPSALREIVDNLLVAT